MSTVLGRGSGRLYVGFMTVPCVRCPTPAVIAMNFNYADRRVWIDDLGEIDSGYVMCHNHAGRLTAPVGWTLTDRRAADQPLFAARDVA